MIGFREFALGLAALLLLAAPASAKVASQSARGFSLVFEADVAADPKAAYDAFIRVGQWWDGEHSYSGSATNISIEVEPGGCWCEALPDGGFVAHMRVAQSMPGKMLMFKGGLGPLAFMGVEGSMVVSFEAKGKATVVKLSYAVGGRDTNDFKELPKLVDGVLSGAFTRYSNYASTGKP